MFLCIIGSVKLRRKADEELGPMARVALGPSYFFCPTYPTIHSISMYMVSASSLLGTQTHYLKHCTLREEKRAIQDNGRSCRSLQRLGGRVGDTDLSLVS